MENIGIRRLKNETSAIIRAVREQNAQYIITYHGKGVAIISPIDDESLGNMISNSDWEERIRSLTAEIDEAWQSEKTAVEILSEQRR